MKSRNLLKGLRYAVMDEAKLKSDREESKLTIVAALIGGMIGLLITGGLYLSKSGINYEIDRSPQRIQQATISYLQNKAGEEIQQRYLLNTDQKVTNISFSITPEDIKAAIDLDMNRQKSEIRALEDEFNKDITVTGLMSVFLLAGGGFLHRRDKPLRHEYRSRFGQNTPTMS